jgi:muconolactone D-isomerase
MRTSRNNGREYLVEFEIRIPRGTPESVVSARATAEAAAAAKLIDQGHLVRLWRLPVASGEAHALGLYRADTGAELDAFLTALPLYEWMHVTVTALEPHPNDPAVRRHDDRGGRRTPDLH